MSGDGVIGTRDYLALRLKPTAVQLSDRQRDAVREYLVRALPGHILNPFARVADRQARIRRALEECVRARVLVHAGETDHRYDYSSPTDTLLEALYAQVVGLDVLEPLLADPEVTSITVINEGTILYEKGGQVYQSPFGFESRERMVEVIKNLAIRGGQQLTPARPTADLAFPPPEVVRVHLTIDPVTPRYGAFCALRRGRVTAWTLDTLVGKGMMDDAVADFIRALMRIPASVIVGGEPASGKTTLLEVMLSLIDNQHVALLEQAAELNPRNRMVSFFEVPPTSETVSLATLTIDSLRKNVQVVVIGETRGSEAGWLLFIAGAMKAILTTLHGRNSRQVVERMATNAQIRGEPPISPFVGNKELARGAVAAAFDFVIHCTQLPDGRRIISSIEHITGVKEGEIKLIPVVTANIQVVEGLRKHLEVTWEFNQEWQWPEDLAFALRMSEVRAEVGREQPGALDARLHRQFQQACLAADQGAHATAVRLFSEVLRPMPAGYLDAEARLRRSLEVLGQWEHLKRWADEFLHHLEEVVRGREWSRLEAALAELEEKVELRVAVASRRDLKPYQERLTAGLDLERRWAEARRRVNVLATQGKPDQAAQSLRQVQVGGLNDELRDEVRRLRLEMLEQWAGMPGVSPEQVLRIYHEMFALVDEEMEPDKMAVIVRQIRELERRVGQVSLDINALNVAGYTRTQGARRQKAGKRQSAGQGEQDNGRRHRIYLQGVAAMNEGRWEEARACFEQTPGYRRADVFMKSLEGLGKREA